LLTLQTTEEYGFANFKRYRENKEHILNEILSEFLDIFEIDDSEVIHKNVHGWLYAFSENQSSEVFWDDKKNIGITGDWFTGGRAENAWINAKLLSEKINN
jgi:predicted NAD/FAD-dependent oxidoreductase